MRVLRPSFLSKACDDHGDRAAFVFGLSTHRGCAQQTLDRSSQPEERKRGGEQENKGEDVTALTKSNACAGDHRDEEQSPSAVFARQD
jgi:hypothetical protein